MEKSQPPEQNEEESSGLCNESNGGKKSDYSFDISTLGLFVNKNSSSSSNSKKLSEGAEPDNANSKREFDTPKREVVKHSRKKNHHKVQSFGNWNGNHLNETRTMSFLHYSPGFGSSESLFKMKNKKMMSNSFSGKVMNYGSQGRLLNTGGLQSAGSLRKRRLTNATVTTMTPEGSLLNKSTEFLNNRLPGSLLSTKNKFLFNTNNSGDYDYSKPYYIEENGNSSQNSLNSNEKMFYNYVANPIYEGPEITQNYENHNLDQELLKPHNFSFNGQLTETEALQLQRNIKSGQNLRRKMSKNFNPNDDGEKQGLFYHKDLRSRGKRATEAAKMFGSKIFNIKSKGKGSRQDSILKGNGKNKGKRSKKDGKKTRRNFMRIFNSKEYDIDMAKADEDPRTTLMIKNIPNKYTQNLILGDINEKFIDAYDFFYLPIDFDNKCNVGYAFINLIDNKYVKSFYERYHNKSWKKFNSEKVCAIKYARIQGRKANLKHFQGSSVMKHNDKRLRPLMLNIKRNKGNIEELVQKQKMQHGDLAGKD